MNLPSLALAFGVAWTPVAVPVPKAVPVFPAATAPIRVLDTNGTARSWEEAVSDLASARVIAVGEEHDKAEYHLIQAEVLTALAARVPRLAVAFEMVTFEDQAMLDAFMSGRASEADFSLWWKKHWGYDYTLYKPIFDAAKAAGVPAYGLNAPPELVKAVAKNGLASLSPADRARLPASIEESSDARYRAYVHENAGHGPLTPDQIKNREQAMAVWNETMGEKTAAIAAAGRVVLVIAGSGHVLYKAGVPESAARRGAGPVKVLLPWSGVLDDKDYLAFADWFRLIENTKIPKAQRPAYFGD